MKLLEESVKQHEGFEEKIYLDSKGIPTCGWGHALLVGTKVPLEVCEIFLRQDLANAVSDFYKLRRLVEADVIKGINEVRRRVITEMLFNMGLPRVLGFVKMWEAIRVKDWDRAAEEMLDSKWHKDVGKRAETLAETFKQGGEK